MAKKSDRAGVVRAPIITVMGHVDHGKTSLLDALRETRVVDQEEGGITQHVGAYQIEYKGKPITFIDTPGHAAFSEMRRRGSQVTDIVLLVVAATEGVKPQTVESIKHIQKAEVPLIVVINKMDMPGASPDMVKAQLMEHGIYCEGYGGQTPAVPISALKKQGLNDLLDMILLVAELEELSADPKNPVDAVVIESSLDKSRGPLATVIVLEGTLSQGQTVFYGATEGKIRALFNDKGKAVKEVLPGQPAVVMGLSTVPPVGVSLTATSGVAAATAGKFIEEPETPHLNLILKADTAGTLEAVQSNLPAEIHLIATGVGPINESDILLSATNGALIVGFAVPVTPAAKKLAETEKVKIELYGIIYKLFEAMEKRVLRILEPTIDETELATAEVLAIFNMKGDKIAGCKVKTGELTKSQIHLVRDGKIIGDARIRSLKQGKEDVTSVKTGNECGVILTGNLDYHVGDVIQSYKNNE
jgi:translation initiation factor IF-2